MYMSVGIMNKRIRTRTRTRTRTRNTHIYYQVCRTRLLFPAEAVVPEHVLDQPQQLSSAHFPRALGAAAAERHY